MSRKTVLLGMPRSAFVRTFPPHLQERLWAEFDVLEPASPPATADLLALAEGHEIAAVLTTWGAPAVPTAFWQAHPECRYFGHMAGSVKHFFPDDTCQYLLDHDITVVSGQFGLGINVAEMTVGLMITLSRQFPVLWQKLRHDGVWRVPEVPMEPQGLLGATVGLVSASVIGRLVAEMIRPFRCRVLMFDPYLTDARAAELGVEKVSLERLLSESDIVSMHHPQTPETDRMIGQAQFDLLRDGALFINTARPRGLDPEALLAAARQNRITIALDVTEPEPLPADHPLRECENVYLTPHVAGTGRYGTFMVGEIVIEGLDQFLAGQTVTAKYPVERMALMA